MGNSLAFQWLGLGTFTAVGPGQGTKIPRDAWCGQKQTNKQTKESMWIMVPFTEIAKIIGSTG